MRQAFAALRALVLLSCFIGTTAPALADQSNTNHLKKRKMVAEMLATAVAIEMDGGRHEGMDDVLRRSVKGDIDVLSAAVRKSNGELISDVGNHSAHWVLASTDRSTPTQAQIPLYKDGKRFMMVELRFNTLENSSPSNRLYFADVIASHISPDWFSGAYRPWLNKVLSSTVENHRYVLSAAIRRTNGELVESVGDHHKYWGLNTRKARFTKRLSAPIYRSGKEVAIVEVTVKTLTGVDVLNRLLF